MREKDKLIEYFEKGYFINGPVLEASKVFDTNLPKYAPFKGKTLILLRKGEDTIEIATDNEETIKLAIQKLEDQNTPIGTLVKVACEVLGTNTVGVKNFDLESFVQNLNDNSKWDFELNESNSGFSDSIFIITIRIESIDTQVIDEQIGTVQHFIDFLAFFQDIGIIIHSIEKCPIPKEKQPILLRVGPTYKRLEKLPKDVISKISDNLACSGKKELFSVVNGLNRSYVENYLPNRVSVLWATVETLFGNKAEHLLKNNEIKVLINCIEQLDIWKSENDKERLEKLKIRIKDPNVLSLKNRNERIASSISDELNVDYNETLKMIQFVTKVRGKYLHELRKDEQIELRNAEEYLQNILKSYIKKTVNSL